MVDKSLQEKLIARKYAARDIATAISNASDFYPPEKRSELQALASRITLCSDPLNQWQTSKAINFETGEEYAAVGRYWTCGSKLCPSCIADKAREHRKRLRAAIARQKHKRGERLNFTTLTMPNVGLSLIETRSIADRAWTLLRKRSLFASLFRGGCKSEEFTVTAKGFHYHFHLLTLGKWFLFQELRRTWTDCVRQAFADSHVPFEVMTRDGLLLVKVQAVVGLERAVQEVCKYITKSDSWTKMPVTDVGDIGLVRRWFRMFELFGSFADREAATGADLEERVSRSPIVHTKALSDGLAVPSLEYWRDFVVREGIERYEERLIYEYDVARQYRIRQLERQWPEASICNVSPSPTYAKARLIRRMNRLLTNRTKP